MRKYPPLGFRGVVRPNYDTLYSIAWLNLENGPVVVTAPDMGDRFYIFETLDYWSDNFASPGWRTTGEGEKHFMYTPPGWSGKVPKNVVHIKSPTQRAWILGRTKTAGESEFKTVNKLQDQMHVDTLEDFLNGKRTFPARPNHQIKVAKPGTKGPQDIILDMSTEDYFTYAMNLTKTIEPHATDFNLLTQMKKIGLNYGESFKFSSLSRKNRKILDYGRKLGLKQFKDEGRELLGFKKGRWIYIDKQVGIYGNNYVSRAVFALKGLGMPQIQDSYYPQAVVDRNDNDLMGGKKYRLHLRKEQIPSVNGFWSFTIYDADGFVVPNKQNKATISSWMDLKKNSDGSMDFYFQPNAPKDNSMVSNWLPTPKKGTWNLTMRWWSPTPEQLEKKVMLPAIREVKANAH